MFDNLNLTGFPRFITRGRLRFLKDFALLQVKEFKKNGIDMSDPAGLDTYYTSAQHFRFARIVIEINTYHLRIECFAEVIEDDTTRLIPHEVSYCHRLRTYPYMGVSIIKAGKMFLDQPLAETYSPAHAKDVVSNLICVAQTIEDANIRARTPESMAGFERARNLRHRAREEESAVIQALRAQHE